MIKEITPALATAPFGDPDVAGYEIVDVRNLVDRRGNPSNAIRAKIDEALSHLRASRKVCICCDYGISRSNSIAAGVLSDHEAVSFATAVERVLEATSETQIKLEMLATVATVVHPPPSQDQKPTCLVTGAGGFLGTALFHSQVADDLTLCPVGREVCDLEETNTGLYLAAQAQSADTLIHLANPSIYTTNQAFGQMLTILKNVVDTCVVNDIHLVQVSSWQVFAGHPETQLVATPETPRASTDTYSLAALLSEQLVEESARSEGLNYTRVRLPPVYGVGSDRPKFIRHFLSKAREDSDITTHCYDNGRPGLDLLHVSDAVAGIAHAAVIRPGCTLHLGTGKMTTTHDVASHWIKKTGSSATLGELQLKGTVSNVTLDTASARSLLGWEARTDLEEGLDQIFAETVTS